MKHICKICNKEVSRLIQHLEKVHNTPPKDYYDKFLKQPEDGYCLQCHTPTEFSERIFGYKKFCSKSCTLKHTHKQIQNDPERKAKWSEHSRKLLSDAWKNPTQREKWKSQISESKKSKELKPKATVPSSRNLRVANLEDYKHQVQTFRCPYCEYEFTGVSSRGLKLHLSKVHNISDGEWVEFLRDVYWPLYYPDKPTHCTVCGAPTKFRDFSSGFGSVCSKCNKNFKTTKEIKRKPRKRKPRNISRILEVCEARVSNASISLVPVSKAGVLQFIKDCLKTLRYIRVSEKTNGFHKT